MPAPSLIKTDWQNDRVYLVQFPRSGCIPSISPFSLKLETWLRMTGIAYSNIGNELLHSSARKQIPYIEINGRHVPDSNLCINYLKEHFKIDIDSKLTAEEKAQSTALLALIEDALFWILLNDRSKNFKFLMSDIGLGRHVTGTDSLNKLRETILEKSYVQGTGRLTDDEASKRGFEILNALSTLLSHKDFFFGSHPTTIDAAAFGHLTQFYYTPLALMQHADSFMEKETPNLVKFILRMKEAYWSDWDEAIRTLSFDTKHRKKNDE